MEGQVNSSNLKTDRSLLKYILLSAVTCGIYHIYVMTTLTDDVNTICSKYDNKKTMHFCLLFFLLTPITCGIANLVYFHNLSNRIGDELKRRGINLEFNSSTFWLWNILGSMIVVGPFVYFHKLFTAMNALCEDYNQKG